MLNPATGRLTVEGVVDLEAIRREGRKENYTIAPIGTVPADPTPAGERRAPGRGARPTGRGVDWGLVRTLVSGAALAAAFVAARAGAAAAVFVPLYVAAMVIGGWGNARKAYHALPRLDFNMSVLMTVAVIGAAAIGEWEEGAIVAFLYAVSELLESRTMDRARRSIRELMDRAPRVATVRRDGGEVQVPAAEVRVGDVVIIWPGEMIPVDGRVVAGRSAVDEAPITGESVPVDKEPGAEVFAGTLNTDGSLEVEVTRRAEDTTLARIIHLVEEAQARRAPSQAFVDRFAAVYTPIVLTLAAGLAVVPPLVFDRDWGPWIYRGLALLVVSCPCALVVSTPVAIVSAIANAARHGVLIKGGVHLEAAGALTAVAFDKTGTLTRARPAVTDVVPLGDRTAGDLLALAAAVEARSEHPLAAAVLREAQARGLRPEPAGDFAALAGRGARATVGGETVYIGNPALFEELGIPVGPAGEQVRRLQAEGKTAVLVGTAQGPLGVIAMADEVRETARATLDALRRAGIRHTVMLTGDNEATARAIAARVGVDEVQSQLLPQDKVRAVEALRRRHGKVAMVGDGINDAPALAAATVGIAMGGAGTDAALETADIVLMADDLTKLPFTVRLSRATLRVIRQNIAFSIAVKLLAVLAAFPGWLTLWLAILADMGASVLVTLNGMRLLRVEPRHRTDPPTSEARARSSLRDTTR
ncbi:cadmium transporter [Caldinitratiruptor microaerophilus]|uniref:Cd(2+)-exporting ATPase n=1 Tax=Caldinitratiruptor microaerophilus TaxID=671077 RepID=A0AA35CM28_9FIRM|nr:cadmium transporter [Caldinitratiruptor microaerophilus]